MAEEIQEEVLYDDYFSAPGDAGAGVDIEHRGRKLHFVMRKSLTIGERQQASLGSVKISLTPEGKPQIDDINQSTFTTEILLKAIKEWPFKYKSGEPVPITKQTVAAMDPFLADKLIGVVMGQDMAQVAALGPFAAPSAGVSELLAAR